MHIRFLQYCSLINFERGINRLKNIFEFKATASKAVAMVRPKERYPPKQGLYSPEFEKEACGVGFVAKINGEKSNQVCTEFCSFVLTFSGRVSPRMLRLGYQQRDRSFTTRVP